MQLQKVKKKRKKKKKKEKMKNEKLIAAKWGKTSKSPINPLAFRFHFLNLRKIIKISLQEKKKKGKNKEKYNQQIPTLLINKQFL